MQIDISEQGNATIVAPEGPRLDAEVAGDFRATLLGLIEGGKGNLIVNLDGVDFIDSSGLGELVGAYATGANQGAQIKLLNVQKRVHDLIQITKLYTVFESFTSETAALRSFGAKAASV